MLTGKCCALRPNDSVQALLSSYLRTPAATSIEQAATLQKARLFLFARNLLYLLVFVSSALRLACGNAAGGNPESRKT